jgi:hypothetical protein
MDSVGSWPLSDLPVHANLMFSGSEILVDVTDAD